MSDFLANLIQRSSHANSSVQPHGTLRYEPLPLADEEAFVTAETIMIAPAVDQPVIASSPRESEIQPIQATPFHSMDAQLLDVSGIEPRVEQIERVIHDGQTVEQRPTAVEQHIERIIERVHTHIPPTISQPSVTKSVPERTFPTIVAPV